MPHASKPSENGHYDHGVLVRVGADAFGIPHGGGISRKVPEGIKAQRVIRPTGLN